VESLVELVMRVAGPPATGTLYTLKMPLSSEENSTRCSSALNDAPRTAVVAMNCSTVYSFDGRRLAAAGACAHAGAAKAAARVAQTASIRVWRAGMLVLL
jgi:hypothetical protein